MLAVLLQPLTGDDLVKILTVFFAGTAVVIYAWRGPSPAKGDMSATLQMIHQTMANILLNIKPAETTSTTTTTTTPDASQTTTTVETSKPAQAAALADTVNGMPVVAAPAAVVPTAKPVQAPTPPVAKPPAK